MHVQRIVNATLVASLAFTGSYISAPAVLADEALPTDAAGQNSLASMIGTADKTVDATIKQGEESIRNKSLASAITSLKSGAETTGNEPTSEPTTAPEPTNTPTPTPDTVADPTIILVADIFTYNGAQHKPEILEIRDPDGNIVPKSTYTEPVEYGTNTHVNSDATANQNYVKVTFNGTGTYPAGHSVTKPITINPKQVTVTASKKYKIVNEPDPAFTAEVDGTIDGEKDKIIYSLERNPGETEGIYEIKPIGEVKQGDYTVSFVYGTLKILSSTTTLVSSEDELRYALSSSASSSIVLADNITVSDQILDPCSHNVTIDLEGHTLNLGNNGPLDFSGGDVVISNGTISAGTSSTATSAIKITGGTLKLGSNVTVVSPSSAVAASGTSKVTIDDTTITAGSSEYSALIADDTSTITATNLTLTPNTGATAIKEGVNADVTLESGLYHVTSGSDISPYLLDGYAPAYITSFGAYSPRKNLADDDHTKVTLSPGPYKYEGEDVEPTVTVTFDGVTVSSSDYDVTYADNDAVGKATVTVTAKDESDYTGSNTTATFEIESGAVEVEDSDVTLSQTSFTYNGKEQAPTVKVTVNGESVSSKHYDIEYSDNTDAGTAKVEVSFDGEEYEGDITKEFTIEQKEVTVTPANKTKTAGDSDPTFTATVSGTLDSDTVKYKLTRDSGESAGTYTIKASGDTSQGNYKVTYKTGTLTIKAKSTSSSSSSSSSPSSTKSTTTTSTKTTTSSNNSGTSSKSNNTNSNSSSSSSSNKNSSSTGSSIGASSANSTSSKANSTAGTGSSSATTNKTPTAATGAADTSTSAAVTTTKQPTARTADPSFTGFGTLVTSALAALGIGLRTKRRNDE